ncbi:MAG: hypothetical protein ACFFD4_35305 [Candidatus Odinarchaeota archaeon]
MVGTAIWDFQFKVNPIMQDKPGYREQINVAFQDFLRTDQAPWIHGPDERELDHRDGTRRIVQSITFPIKIPDTLMVGSILRDITGQKQVGKRVELLYSLPRHNLKNRNQIALGYLRLLQKG